MNLSDTYVIYWIIYTILDKYWIIDMFYPRNTSEMQKILRFIIDEFKAFPVGRTCSTRVFTSPDEIPLPVFHKQRIQVFK